MKKELIIFAAAALSLLAACGNEDDGQDGSFYAVLESNPQNLDPQLAYDEESFYIIRNIYAALMDLDANGAAVNGAAESYSVSEDGLVYKFTLRKGLCWQGIGTDENIPLTAYDYEYAFKRIYDPLTHSPHTERFSAIKNSMSVYKGDMSADMLGVSAEDAYTLVIELSHPDCDFLKLLSHPAASPCNEELFLSTRGRYGLSAKDTYACGAFFVSDWNYDPYWTDNHITLERIEENSREGYETFPESVHLEITSDRAAFESENDLLIDCYKISDIALYDKAVSRDYLFCEYTSAAVFLIFSPDSPIASDENARRAIAAAIDREALGEGIGDNSAASVGIFPDALTVGGRSFRELVAKSSIAKSTADPEKLWSDFKELHSETDFNSYIMLVSDSLDSEDIPHMITADLENSLEFYCTVVFEDGAEFEKRLSGNDYDLCIAAVNAGFNTAGDYIESLIELADIRSAALAAAAARVGECADISQKIDAMSSFEAEFLDNAYAIPLTYEKKYLLYRENTEDIRYDPFTDTVFFKYAKQK